MALSNWDTLAIDLEGNPTNGIFISPKSGVKVELYKNWAYICDPKGWHEGGGYVKDVVGQVESGSLHYYDINIEAIQGPQNGIYVACWTVEWPPPKGEERKPKYYGMIGCGVYGFEGEKWIGVSKESFDFLRSWISNIFDKEIATVNFSKASFTIQSK